MVQQSPFYKASTSAGLRWPYKAGGLCRGSICSSGPTLKPDMIIIHALLYCIKLLSWSMFVHTSCTYTRCMPYNDCLPLANLLQARNCAAISMAKQNSVRWTGNVRLDVGNSIFVKYTHNRSNSDKNYAWYLNRKQGSGLVLYTVEAYWKFYFEEATRQPGRWPLQRGPLWCDYVATGRVWWVATGEM